MNAGWPHNLGRRAQRVPRPPAPVTLPDRSLHGLLVQRPALTLAVSHDGGQHFERAPNDVIVAALPYRSTRSAWVTTAPLIPATSSAWAAINACLHSLPRQVRRRTGAACSARTRSSTLRPGAGGTAPVLRRVRRPVYKVGPTEAACARARRRRPLVLAGDQSGPPRAKRIIHCDNAEHRIRRRVFCATSPDLLSWSVPALLLTVTGPPAWQCGDPDPTAYPSLLDPASDRYFEIVGAKAPLFATRFEVDRCKSGVVRHRQRWVVTTTAR